ncbi:hypothetical protein VCRA2128O305_210005 [Vibrio crassostreae]|uniref:Uncharacterized protein n=1 Tax=Vibrio crassostreae TaxID=246167 RepID=A0A822MRJ8_9VIBR|nr:hypothetical protein VCRA2112E186_180005 [Vibrio crassostreae]CAK1819286.1 hypothetical protein VCRA2110O113_170098 [Vibrio crassostreae]CAK1890712.1 hypothetical protein VCRA2114E123_210010 [Vibrio crassostreae]CAK1961809.1 hypothetical protein VCRA2113O138_280004 [Vibrio crassostreae]CAK2194787.1 hypothetical protein VCRA2112O189_60004 [Vibrio crassostreae]
MNYVILLIISLRIGMIKAHIVLLYPEFENLIKV